MDGLRDCVRMLHGGCMTFRMDEMRVRGGTVSVTVLRCDGDDCQPYVELSDGSRMLAACLCSDDIRRLDSAVRARIVKVNGA